MDLLAGARGEFADLWIWERVGDRLPWYFAVASNRMPAKYLITRRVPVSVDLEHGTEDELWKEHGRATEAFLKEWSAVRGGSKRFEDAAPASPSLLDLSVALVRRMLRRCTFCRWNCRVDRSEGTKHGTCQLADSSRVGSYFHHRGEELVFRGTQGSGTIFFTSCNLRCQFCQNGDISHDKDNGIPVTPEMIAAMAYQLRLEGCHNINLVGGEPTIHLHNIVEAISLLPTMKASRDELPYVDLAKADAFRTYRWRPEQAFFEGEFNAPILWNSNFFMSDETMRILRPLVDVWLPDFKFGSNKCSTFLSRTPWYFETVARNHKLTYDWGEDMLIRHLVMPDHVDCCTRPVLKWIAENTPQALVNVMDQYHPDYACNPMMPEYDPRYAALSRRPYASEVLEAYAYAKELGLRFEEVALEKRILGLDPLPPSV